ncbi:MAG: AI-2E family transporter [Candidatus Pacebacteria bacterium]|nr:AI-2E family transporter [Candidatus Paceibacterota bacterium]NUQ57292.1 AI-2E family transporter [Candidatus Paceibacter sp.]
MLSRNLQTYFLFTLVIGVLVLSFFIFRPFIYALALAAAVVIVFEPFQRLILKRWPNHQGLAAFLSTLAILALIAAPSVFLGIRIFKESQQLYVSLLQSGEGSVINILNDLANRLGEFFPIPSEFSLDVESYLRQGLSWLIGHLGDIFSNFAKMGLSFIVFIIAVYYFFKDGHNLKKKLVDLSPLADDSDETIFRKLRQSVNSVIKGNLIIALIKGALSAIGFIIFGISNPVLWGTVSAVAALVPGVGTAIVFVPAVLFLFLGGKVVPAAGLLVWGAAVVGMIDNFLGPKLIGRGMRLHPLIVLLSVLGGIALFGPVGFLIGPIILSLLFALLDIYSCAIKTA